MSRWRAQAGASNFANYTRVLETQASSLLVHRGRKKGTVNLKLCITEALTDHREESASGRLSRETRNCVLHVRVALYITSCRIMER
jgi:hypothetical protein